MSEPCKECEGRGFNYTMLGKMDCEDCKPPIKKVDRPVQININDGEDILSITHNEAYKLWRQLDKIYGGRS